MHKKLAADLTSLAHSILQMKNKNDVFALKKKAYEVYEKLSVLAYVEEYMNTTPNPEHSKEEWIEKLENVQKTEVVETPIEFTKESEGIEEEIVVHSLDALEEELQLEEIAANEDIAEAPEQVEIELFVEPEIQETHEVVQEIEEKAVEFIEEVTSQVEEEVKEAVALVKEVKPAQSLDEELKDTIALDVVADLFENATKKSLNDSLQGDIQIGLNDRIAFVKNLFEGSQEDFNRVISQLNTFKSEKEAKRFISKMVKPDYDWSEKEEYEERFMAIIERKFA